MLLTVGLLVGSVVRGHMYTSDFKSDLTEEIPAGKGDNLKKIVGLFMCNLKSVRINQRLL